MVRCIFSPARAWRPAGVARLARTLGRMKQATVLHILKLDAERRQLEVATRLYFFDATPVSIHTLGAASYGILRDYAVSKDVELQTAEQGILRRVVQGKKGDLMVALRKRPMAECRYAHIY